MVTGMRDCLLTCITYRVPQMVSKKAVHVDLKHKMQAYSGLHYRVIVTHNRDLSAVIYIRYKIDRFIKQI